MRKLILIGICLAAAVLSAGEPLYKGKFREFPVPGTIAAARRHRRTDPEPGQARLGI